MTGQDKIKTRALTKTEETILEALHFMLSFEELKEETGLTDETLADALRVLIRDELAQVLAWQADKDDFIALDEIPSDLSHHHFLATKRGLFSYHS
ncbi:MAG: hypothetical protein NZM06_11835 [Chloroherpetonaceae bacterium]|nr:hypothetical protein [Chloroherpetonaceae bacterium]MDW8437986.1 hypothetical protein [Chloroherpetonaceae bacterium]